ncbi:hypothetical protein [Spongorhabdus nitratireducens]
MIERHKGSLDNITLWTPWLRKAIDKLMAIRPNPENHYLQQRTKSKGIVTVETRFPHKDMKAKGTSDHLKLVKQLKPDPSVSGHKTEGAQSHYIRKPLMNDGTR